MKTHITLAIISLFLWSGCYTSPVPIAPLDQAPALPEMAGEWMQTNKVEDEAPMRLRISRVTDTLFDLVATSTDTSETDVLRFQGYASLVGDHYFGNLKILDEKDDGYLIVRFDRMDSGNMKVQIVSSELMDHKPTTTEALREFIEEHADNPALYEDNPMYFQKVY